MNFQGTFESGFGYDLCFEVCGSGYEKVIFIMGFLCNRAYWGSLIDELHGKYPGKYTTLCFDQRGTGESTDSLLAKMSTSTLGRDILGLLLHLNWIDRKIPLHIVGWSMGGFAALEFMGSLLQEIHSSLNICSITLANTGQKFTFPTALGFFHSFACIVKGAMSCLLNGRGRWIIRHVLSLHFSSEYTKTNFSKLEHLYFEKMNPFSKPINRQLISLAKHLVCAATHHVASKKIDLIRDSAVPIHAIVSTKDQVIHSASSVALAGRLECGFTLVKGGHMSHFENSSVFLTCLLKVWSEGLDKKFPHFKRIVQTQFSSSPSLKSDEARPNRISDWPSDQNVLSSLEKLYSSLDTSYFTIERVRHPGRIFVLPLLLSPIILRLVLRLKSRQQVREDIGIFLYIVVLLLIVQEITRNSG
jgi:pimeloyl-ACP methyl ester carboxylesterase